MDDQARTVDIDFAALIPQPIVVRSRSRQEWKVQPELMGDEAVYFLRRKDSLIGEEAAEKCIAVSLRCFRVHQPDLDEHTLLTNFTLSELITIVMRFLALSGLGRFSPPPKKETPSKSKAKRH